MSRSRKKHPYINVVKISPKFKKFAKTNANRKYRRFSICGLDEIEGSNDFKKIINIYDTFEVHPTYAAGYGKYPDFSDSNTRHIFNK